MLAAWAGVLTLVNVMARLVVIRQAKPLETWTQHACRNQRYSQEIKDLSLSPNKRQGSIGTGPDHVERRSKTQGLDYKCSKYICTTASYSVLTKAHITWEFTPVTSLIASWMDLSTSVKFAHHIKGLWCMLSGNKCYGLRPLLTAL